MNTYLTIKSDSPLKHRLPDVTQQVEIVISPVRGNYGSYICNVYIEGAKEFHCEMSTINDAYTLARNFIDTHYDELDDRHEVVREGDTYYYDESQ